MFENIKKKLKLGYYNPNSPKYYKGFRYSKNKSGTDYWNDENGTIRKVISYYNGNKLSECYYNEEGEHHNEDGYAYKSWHTNGDIFSQLYYLNGKELTEDVFKKIINNKNFESTYPSSPNYYNGYIYVKTETNEEYWYDDKFNIKKRNIYYENGILKEERIYGEKIQTIRFNKKSEIECKNDIAVAGYGEKDGYYLSGRKLSYFEWYLLRVITCKQYAIQS